MLQIAGGILIAAVVIYGGLALLSVIAGWIFGSGPTDHKD